MDYLNTNYTGKQNNVFLSSGSNTNPVFLTNNNNIIQDYNTINTVHYPIHNSTTVNYSTTDNEFLNDKNYAQNFISNNNNNAYDISHYNTGILNYGNLPYSTEGDILSQTYYHNTEEYPKQNKEIFYDDMSGQYTYNPNSNLYIDNIDVDKYMTQLLKISPEQNNNLYIENNDTTNSNDQSTKMDNYNNNEQQNTELNKDNNKENNQNQTQVKPRRLTNKDFINIVYKEIGMINLGNTCYINSCLQVLIHCNLFIYKFFNKYSKINQEETPISFHLFKICAEMMNTVNTLEKSINIAHFKNAFGMKHQIFQGFSQNDSQEFCRILLEDLNDELNEVKNKPLYRELTNSDRKDKITREREFNQNFKDREKSIITDLFYGQIITTYTCQCKAEIYSFQKLLDFPLLLPENETNIDIKDLLKKYFQSETIDFETECEKCKKKLEHRKDIKISRPPEILILSLQRIDEQTKNKNECIVNFPRLLDMTEFIDHDCGFDNEPFYYLYAVINHIGNMESGHYFSYIRMLKTKEWFEFNDSVVKKIENKIETFPNAYALFYIKKQQNPSS